MPQYYTLVGHKPKNAKSKHVMLATPTSRAFCAAYTLSLSATIESLVRNGYPYTLELLVDHCHVDDARNNLIRKFLRSGCTDLLYIDSDMGWESEAVIRVLEVPGDVVSGVYRYKSDEEGYPFHPGEGEREANENGLFTMPKTATGFMRIRRPVLEALYEAEKNKGRTYWSKGDNRASDIPIARIVERAFIQELDLPNIDTTRMENYHSGDYVLCLKARNLGFEVLADVEMNFSHVGEKVWKGHAGNFLRKKKGIDNPGFFSAMKELIEGREDLRTFEKLVKNSHNPTFTAPAKLLKAVYDMALETKGPILECGSGLSTLVMGVALSRKNAPWAVHALENDLNWTEQVGKWLQFYGIENVALYYTPLIPYERGNWYGIEPSQLPEQFDSVFVDGPPRIIDGQFISERSVLWDVLGEQIKEASTWIVDDTSTLHEKRVVQQYTTGRTLEWIEDLPDNKVHSACIARKQPMAIAAE